MDFNKTIAVLGGTGSEGAGLAARWAHAGYDVIIGSRAAERAVAAADKISALTAKAVRGMANAEAAALADIIVLAVPFAAQRATALSVRDELASKTLVDVTVPLVPPKVAKVQLPEGGSAVEALQRELGAGVRVVSAFQNVSAHHLLDLSHVIDCDVLICGDDDAACEQVVELAAAAGMQGLRAGVLANSVAAEALTSVLIAINRRYKVPSTGIRITGLKGPASLL